jgi:hypothetical protein
VRGGAAPQCSLSAVQGQQTRSRNAKATAKEAIPLGLELMGKGFQSVYITSPDGVYWGPQQFPTLLVTHGEKPRSPGS